MPLPLEEDDDQVIWSGTSSGTLSAREAYSFLAGTQSVCCWGKAIWHSAIQPRKSVTTWKVLLDRILTDDLLQRRGGSLMF